jgi:hypothetical protein
MGIIQGLVRLMTMGITPKCNDKAWENVLGEIFDLRTSGWQVIGPSTNHTQQSINESAMSSDRNVWRLVSRFQADPYPSYSQVSAGYLSQICLRMDKALSLTCTSVSRSSGVQSSSYEYVTCVGVLKAKGKRTSSVNPFSKVYKGKFSAIHDLGWRLSHV